MYLEMVKMVNFTLSVFYHDFFKVNEKKILLRVP